VTLHLVGKKGNRIPPITNQSQQLWNSRLRLRSLLLHQAQMRDPESKSPLLQRHSNPRFGFPQPDDESPVPTRIIRKAILLGWQMHALNRHGETFGTDINAAVHRFLDPYGSALRLASAPVHVRSHGLALVAAGSMPSILHGVTRKRQWPFSATGSGLLRPQVGTAFLPNRNHIVTP